MSHKKDLAIADQQKALKTAEKALAEARKQIDQAYRWMQDGNSEAAQSILSSYQKKIGVTQ